MGKSVYISGFSDWFRVCARCGATSWLGTAYFCDVCLWGLAILSEGALLNVSGLPFEVRALYCWGQRQDAWVRPLVYALKGGRPITAFQRLGETFSCRLSASGVRPGELVFVPPPRRQRTPDHAYRWAEALARTWGAPVLDLLAFEDLREAARGQKSLTADERHNRRFVAEGFSRLSNRATVVFADDVLTTGSTALAAYEALGKPTGFEAWVLAYRPKLAGNRLI